MNGDKKDRVLDVQDLPCDDPFGTREVERRLAGPTLEGEAIIARRQWEQEQKEKNAIPEP